MSHLSHYGRRGVLISRDKESGKETQSPVKSCVHCGCTWQPRKGSGRLVGFCQRCSGDLCGQPACVARGCVPQEAMIEMMEAGLPEHLISEAARPVRVANPGIVLG